jgi:tight adherence protein C
MLLVLALVGITVFLASTLLILMLPAKSAAEARLIEAVRNPQTLNIRAPAAEAGYLNTLGSVTRWVRGQLGLEDTSSAGRELARAGFRKPQHVDIYYAVKLLLPAVLAILVSLFVSDSTVFWLMAAASLGYFLPDLYLTRQTKARRERIRKGLPDALDLLVICMEAGLGLDQALMRVSTELSMSHPDLTEEFRLINLEQKAGAARIQAWRNMGERTQLDIVSAFVSMLVQTDRFGTPISRSLSQFSDTMRLERKQKAEELAAKTSVKLIFPLVLFIFPSMFIVLLAPALISIRNNMDKLFS